LAPIYIKVIGIQWVTKRMPATRTTLREKAIFSRPNACRHSYVLAIRGGARNENPAMSPSSKLKDTDELENYFQETSKATC
jgi:hypothetical protein